MSECSDFYEDLVALSRGEPMRHERRTALEQHLVECSACSVEHWQQTWLSGALKEASEQSAEPPLALGVALQGAFQKRAASKRSRVLVLRAAAACLAVGATVSGAFYFHENQRRQPPVTRAAAEPDDFAPIPFAPPLAQHEHVDVYRVRLHRSELASFGMRPITVAGGSVVTADIVVGDDGVARGIRIVR